MCWDDEDVEEVMNWKSDVSLSAKSLINILNTLGAWMKHQQKMVFSVTVLIGPETFWNSVFWFFSSYKVLKLDSQMW